MKLAIFVCVIMGAWAHQESVENKMNLLHARRLAGSSLRTEMKRDLCLPYALCLMGTMDIAVTEHREQFPTWAHGLYDSVLPLIKKFDQFKGYISTLPGLAKQKVNSLADKVENLLSEEDAEDDKTFRYLLATHKVGRKLSSRAFCSKMFSCPADVTENLKKTDEQTTAEVVPAVDGGEPKARILGLSCPPFGSKFCGAFWLACNFNGLVGAGIPGNACNFAALFCNAPAYICTKATKTDDKPATTTEATVVVTTKDLPK